MRVLGVDPGLRITGYAVLDADDADAGRRRAEPSLIEAGCVRLRSSDSVADRLVELERDLTAIVERLRPTHACVEKLFSHYKRPVTAAIMGHGRGVTLLVCRRAGLALMELNPTEVKRAVVGAGHASKDQVARAVQAQFRLAEPPSPPDVADAIAIAAAAARRLALHIQTR